MGNLNKLRTTALDKSYPGIYEGKDYANRDIELVYDHAKMFCDACGGYHRI